MPSIHRTIFTIAWPAVLSNISVPLIGLVDTAILGQLDSPSYVAAVAIGASLLSFVYWGFGFLRMGTTGMIARAAGAKDHEKKLQIILQSAVLALVISFIVLLLHPLWLRVGLWFMAPSPTLLPLAESYTSIRIFSLPAVLLTYVMVGWFIGHKNTRWPMVIVLFTNLCNLGLDLLFIVGLGMKSDGAALASMMAEIAGCLLGLGILFRQLEWASIKQQIPALKQLTRYRALLKSNRDLFIRTLCLLFSFAFFTSVGGRLGDSVLAANAIMIQLLLLASHAIDGAAYAAEGLGGEALGAKNLPQFREIFRACAQWTFGISLCLSLLFWLAGDLMYPWFTVHEDVLAVIHSEQIWLILVPMVAAASYLFDGIFIGAVKTRYMMWSMVFSLFAVYFPLWFITRSLGNQGLWMSFVAFNGARGLSLAWVYRRLHRTNGWL